MAEKVTKNTRPFRNSTECEEFSPIQYARGSLEPLSWGECAFLTFPRVEVRRKGDGNRSLTNTAAFEMNNSSSQKPCQARSSGFNRRHLTWGV